MKMDSSERWLLQSVVHWTSPIGVLGALKEAVEEWFNCPALDLKQDELISVLRRLFHNGDLIAFMDAPDSPNDSNRFVPNQQEIKDALSGGTPFYYGLTEQGGRRWEIAANADWTRFYQIESLDEKIVLTGGDLGFMQKTIRAHARSEGFSVVHLRWKTLKPWNVTYWKVLPAGYEATYQYDYSDQYNYLQESFREPAPEFPKWYEEFEAASQ